MPKLYEYLGLIIFFYSNEHEPVHVHARSEDRENKIEFKIVEGKIISLTLKSVLGKKSLTAIQKKNFMNLAKKLADEIVQSWVSYFVYNKKIVSKKIDRLG